MFANLKRLFNRIIISLKCSWKSSCCSANNIDDLDSNDYEEENIIESISSGNIY